MTIVLAIDPKQPVDAYRGALISAGALPEEVVVVQPGDPLPPEFDGLLLSGGVDVDPARYGEVRLNGSVETNPGRDDLEFALLERALASGAAVFGICRGLQLLNVALGGTLWQDLPTQRPGNVPHSFPRSEGHLPSHPAHALRLATNLPPGVPFASALAACGGESVNSRHHQAVKDLAPGLLVLATAPDGLVEAAARPGPPFVAAVQWHPENLVERAGQLALFDEFLSAARASRETAAPLRDPSAAPRNDPAPSSLAEARAPEPS